MWGFFEPVNTTIEQYGTYKYYVSDAMIREAKEYMAQFPAPKHAFQYIEDRKKSEFPPNDYRYSAVGDVGYYTQFKENQKITKAITAELAGRKVSIKTEMKLWLLNSENDENGKLLYFFYLHDFRDSFIYIDGECQIICRTS